MKHDLIGTSPVRRADGSLHYTSTYHSFGQRSAGLFLLGVPGVFCLGGALWGYGRIAALDRLDRQTEVALVCTGLLGASLILWSLVSVANWFWKQVTLSCDQAGNLTITSRVMRLRRSTVANSHIEAIAYSAEPCEIRTTPVDLAEQSRHVASFWIWYVNIDLVEESVGKVDLGLIDVSVAHTRDGREGPVVRFRVIAEEQIPAPGMRPPEPVVRLCRWLHEATGKPVIDGTNWKRYGLEP